MSVKETSLFIHSGIEQLVKRWHGDGAPVRQEVDSMVAYLFGGDTANNAEFGFLSETDPEELAEWSQFLHPAGDNPEAWVEILRQFEVSADEIHTATDGDGEPSIDMRMPQLF